MRALILATAAAAMLTSTAAIAQQSSQPMMEQQTPGAMMGQGMMGQGMMGQSMMGQSMMGQSMMDQGMMGHGMMPMMGVMNPTQHIEGWLAFLKTELKITDAQAPQWNAYADALRANAKRMGDLMTSMMSSGMMGQGMMNSQRMMNSQGMMNSRGMMMPGQLGVGMSLPDRISWAEQHIKAHMEMLQAIKGPATQLYAVLSEEQKRTADQLLSPMGMM